MDDLYESQAWFMSAMMFLVLCHLLLLVSRLLPFSSFPIFIPTIVSLFKSFSLPLYLSTPPPSLSLSLCAFPSDYVALSLLLHMYFFHLLTLSSFLSLINSALLVFGPSLRLFLSLTLSLCVSLSPSLPLPLSLSLPPFLSH